MQRRGRPILMSDTGDPMMPYQPIQPTNLSRRRWLGGSVLALAGMGLACTRQGSAAGAIAAA